MFSVWPVMRSSVDHSSTFAECREASAECRKALCVPGSKRAMSTFPGPVPRVIEVHLAKCTLKCTLLNVYRSAPYQMYTEVHLAKCTPKCTLPNVHRSAHKGATN